MKVIKTFNTLSTIYTVYKIGKIVFNKVQDYRNNPEHEEDRIELKKTTIQFTNIFNKLKTKLKNKFNNEYIKPSNADMAYTIND